MLTFIIRSVAVLVLLYSIAYTDPEIPSSELPLGIFNSTNHMSVTAGMRDSLRDELGMHFVYTTGFGDSTQSRIDEFYQDQLWVILGMKYIEDSQAEDDFWEYEKGHYAKIEAEDNMSSVRFLYQDGTTGDGWFIPDEGDPGDTLVVLDELWYETERKSAVDNDYYPTYRPDMKIWVDTTTADYGVGQIVAVFRVFSNAGADDIVAQDSSSRHNTLVLEDTIWADPFFTVSDTIEWDFESYDFTESSSFMYVTFQLLSHSNCDFKVDWFKVSDVYGRNCIQGDYNVSIRNYVTQTWCEDRILCWFLRDEPDFDMFMPYAHIDNVIKAATDSAFSDTTYGVTNMRGSYWHQVREVKSIIEYDPSPVIMADMYLFFGPAYWNGMTLYSGWGQNENGWGLQTKIDSSIAITADSIAGYVEGENIDWWIVPQTWSQKYDSDSDYKRRLPTKSELACEIFLGLCYNARGIACYSYLGKEYDDYVIRCIRDEDFEPTQIWEALHETIVPYIKAIDSTFMSLDWETAYTVHYGSPSDQPPPSTAWIDSIYAISNSSDPNPDLGWFQIGEFNGPVGDTAKYVMLVNRACSQGELDSDPAPSITAIVRFDPANLGLGDYVYIIDLATGTDSSDWVGIPDTTYSAEMPDGTIPFTTVLGPGQGRLFKIVQTTSKTLSGDINTRYKYQGKITVSGDITIPANETMEIFGPARFEIIRCDDQDGGTDTSLVELIINGKLYAIGTPNDSIIFYPDTLYNCDIELLSNPQAGDWYGIIDKSSDHDTLAYCVIKYGYNGYRGDSTSKAVIRHCEISNNELSSVYLLNTCSDTLTIDSCLISDNGSYGIYAYASLFVANGNSITKNTKCGIIISREPCGSGGDYRLAYNTITCGSEYSTGKGISITGTTTDHPAVVFEGNMIEDFSSSGVHLYRVKVGDWNSETGTRFIGYNKIESNSTYGLWCQYSSPAIYTEGRCDSYNSFSYNSSYGIYCSNSSNPKIKKTKLYDNSTSNLTCVTFSSPNLGETSSFDGNNQFRTVLYDIKVGGLTIIKAQMNYWGEITPDTLDFYPSKAYVVYEPYRSQPCTPSGKIAGAELEIPDQFALYQNYPNPFNPATSISFDLPEASYVKISIYNILGQRVSVLANEYYHPGNHTVVWDSRNRYGEYVASGIYFYLIETSQFADVRKMLILR